MQRATNVPARNSSSSSSSSSIAEQVASVLPETPEFLADATIWGGTGFLLANFHTHLHLPFWACIALTNVCIRSAMIPVALRGARTQVKFGTISPEVQYLITSFTADMKALRGRGMFSQEGSFRRMQSERGQAGLIRITWKSLRGLFKVHKINLMDIFKSPALQIPVFWYFALDLRKIIEGSDPLLAQQLVESSFFWITDLTDPDPFYALPIFTGALLYLNVEMAVGRKTLGGEVSSKSNIQMLLKDAFQTLAVFMPCFMAQQPAGAQLYLATSMVFTLLQAKALRSDIVRRAVDLPVIGAKPKDEGQFLKEYMDVMAERQAARARGGFVLGEGVHTTGANVSNFRTGQKVKSSIVVEKSEEADEMDETKMVMVELPEHTLQTGMMVFPDVFKSTPVPFLPGMMKPAFHKPRGAAPASEEERLKMPDLSLKMMEAANRGEKLERPVEMAPREVLAKREEEKKKKSGPIRADKLRSKWNKKKGKRGKK